MRVLDRILLIFMTLIAVGMVVYHMAHTQLVMLEPTQHLNLHLMLALVLVFLWQIKTRVSLAGKIISLILLLLAIYATGYVFWEYEELEQVRGPIGMLTGQDVLVGSLIILLALEASRRSFGLAFPIVALIFIAYCYLGHLLPPVVAGPDISYTEMMSAFVMSLAGGVYGNVMAVSAGYIFLFVVFGSLLSATGASVFFNRLGAAAGRKLAGGPAISAVISSALVGSITGSALANVATTGTFTIPLMKKAGYRPYQAGAIEAAASTGGQIMPPVMGATAFVLAEMASVPYVEVMAASLLPALLYFLSVGMYAQLQAKKLRIDTTGFASETFTFREFMQEAPLFLGPLTVIVVLLFIGYSPMFTVFWAILSLLAISAFGLWRQGKLRETFPSIIREVRDGALTGAKIAVTCAVLGPIVAAMTLTSLGIRIPSIIGVLCQGSTLLALLLTAFVCILLGMGVPTLAAYLMVAMVGVPTLVNMGVPAFSAHMYVFIFAVFSCITPPVATAAIPASGIAGAKYMKTAFEAAKVGCVGFLIPFFCVFTPQMMFGQTDCGPLFSIGVFLWGLCVTTLFCMSFCGYSFRDLDFAGRVSAFLCSLLMCVAMFYPEPWLVAGAAGLTALFIGRECIGWRRAKSQKGLTESAGQLS